MANMSYCRFRNTLRDLEDCRDALYEMSDVTAALTNAEELRAARAIIRICGELAGNFIDEDSADPTF